MYFILLFFQSNYTHRSHFQVSSKLQSYWRVVLVSESTLGSELLLDSWEHRVLTWSKDSGVLRMLHCYSLMLYIHHLLIMLFCVVIAPLPLLLPYWVYRCCISIQSTNCAYRPPYWSLYLFHYIGVQVWGEVAWYLRFHAFLSHVDLLKTERYIVLKHCKVSWYTL